MKINLENLKSLIKEAIEEQKEVVLLEEPQQVSLSEEDLDEASKRFSSSDPPAPESPFFQVKLEFQRNLRFQIPTRELRQYFQRLALL